MRVRVVDSYPHVSLLLFRLLLLFVQVFSFILIFPTKCLSSSRVVGCFNSLLNKIKSQRHGIKGPVWSRGYNTLLTFFPKEKVKVDFHRNFSSRVRDIFYDSPVVCVCGL